MKSKRIAKILGIGLSVGMVVALLGAIFVAPAAADQMKWTTTNTPDWGDLVIHPGTDILDYDIGGDGDIIFAILEVGCLNTLRDRTCDESPCSPADSLDDYALVKSDDGGVTWTDITCNVFEAASIPACSIEAFDRLFCVSVSQDDEDWLAVVGMDTDLDIWVVASKDGGDNFTFAGEVTDPAGDTLVKAFDLDVSMEVDGIHNIAVAGIDDGTDGYTGAVFRLKAGTWLTGAWEDTGAYVDATTTDYLGWDMTVDAVVACEFSPLFDMDDTIVCLGCDEPQLSAGNAVIQSGMWEGSGGSWNDEAGFPGSAIIDADGETIYTIAFDRAMGLALPDDYDGTDPGARSVFLFVNGLMDPSGVIGGWVIRSDNYALSPVCGPPGDPILASMDVHGDADTGKLMIGELFEWDDSVVGPSGYGAPIDVFNKADYCGGVSVWHTEELDFCCPQWDGACKDPSGPYMALVMYTPDGDKEYASTSGTFSLEEDGSGGYGDLVDIYGGALFSYAPGTPLDESAFSVSRDDAVSFNQLGLIDTDIDWLSDVAVCPDCATIYLSTINDGCEYCVSCGCVGETFIGENSVSYSDCDSVWRSYDDGDTWERIFHGEWTNNKGADLLLRLPCDAIEDCCDQDAVAPSGTIYLGLQRDDEIFYSRDCGQCWNNPPATKDIIRDFAVESENIIHVLFANGKVSSSTQYGRRWSTPVSTDLTRAHSITSCCEQGFLVVGPDIAEGGKNKVAWSDDGGESWTLTDALPSGATGEVHVACDPVCENIIYAAVDGLGIYRTDVTSGAWDDLGPLPYGYTGIVVAREGTLYAATDELIVSDGSSSDVPLFTDCKGRDFIAPSDFESGDSVYSGVARNLTPCDTACCGTEDWDYLLCGMTAGTSSVTEPGEEFNKNPTSLRICGCLSADTNSVLWAIDAGDRYEMSADCVSGTSGDVYPNGALWSYEDCAAKAGPDLTAPADGAVLDCEACAGCGASPFTLKWERMCLACSYDVQIMDEDGNLIVEWVDKTITGDPPKLYVDSSEMFMVEADGDITIYFPSDDGLLECGNTYTWKVREANTSCECVHSPWSETWSFTVAVGTADAIKLLAPVAGALGVPIANIGFSWTSVPDATTYSFVLSPNAALTGALASQNLSSTAFNFVGPLDYDKAYYWQIKAWKDSQLLTTSAIGVFNTGSEPVTPPPPVVVEPTPAPVLSIPPAQHITPTWIYAIIGIGAALAVVVIVLIVRTRRP